MRAIRVGVWAVVLATVFVLAAAPIALAAAPPSVPATVTQVQFENSGDNITQVYKNPDNIPTSTAWWGERAGTGIGGSGGLWSAANYDTTPTVFPIQPQATKGMADWQVPDTSPGVSPGSYYQSWISFMYRMPSTSDYLNFIVNWYATNPEPSPIGAVDYMRPDYTIGTLFVPMKFERTSNSSLKMPGYVPSSAGWLDFWYNDDNAPGLHQGVQIDDLALTGYKYGPLRSVTAVRDGTTTTDVTISWTKPVTAPGGSTADSRTMSYRVWRHDINVSPGTWTELTSDSNRVADATHQFVDHGVSDTHSYGYVVQAWDPASSTMYGVVSSEAVAAADNMATTLTGSIVGTSSTSVTYPYHTPLTITGALTDGTSAPITGVGDVVLQSSPTGSVWTTVTAAVTEPSPGTYSTSLSADVSSFYRLHFPGVALTYNPASSPTLQITTTPVNTAWAFAGPSLTPPWDGQGVLKASLSSVTEPALTGQISGGHVVVQTSPDGQTGWATDAPMTTSLSEAPGGVYIANTPNLKAEAFYRYFYAGDANHAPATSAVFDVQPQAVSSVFVGAYVSALNPGYGGATMVVATLQGPANNNPSAPLPGMTVVLMSSPDASTWSTTTVPVAGASGTYWAVPTGISTGTWYKLVFIGDGTYPRADTGPYQVLPHVYLTTPSSKPSVTHSKSFTVTGYIKPKFASGGHSVKVLAYHYEKGKWILRASASAKNYNYSSYTKYSVSMKLKQKGSWRLYASHAQDSNFAATTSGYRKLTVK